MSKKSLSVEGWFRIVMPEGLSALQKCVYINRDDWNKRVIRALIEAGCTFEPVHVLTDEQLLALTAGNNWTRTEEEPDE